MTKSLRSMTKVQQEAAITRRLASNVKGLGYWAAFDARKAQVEKARADMKKAAEGKKS